MTGSRFDYAANLGRAGTYRAHRGAFWPPAESHVVSCLDLAATAPELGHDALRGLTELRDAIDAEWRRTKEAGAPGRTRFTDPRPVAAALRAVGQHLRSEVDRHAVTLRAAAIEDGYDDDILKALADVEEDVAVVAGQIATWYGKQLGGLPTAFACRRDDTHQAKVQAATGELGDVSAYLAGLHADLRLGDTPAFLATQLFFMAGEGNLHPKHIAYFLPEDEGVKYSPFKKTYYFANTHRGLLASQSAPLAARFLDIGVDRLPTGSADVVPTLGVLGHELGHCVHRPTTAYKPLNTSDRWASVVLQETAADVFGILILADVWCERLGLDPADTIAYYLSECLRYVNRGLGHFPDSDGMFLQLSYFVQLGALTIERDHGPRLVGDPDVVRAGLRSLARVLGDTLLAPEPGPAVALHRAFGPTSADPLRAFVDEMARHPAGSIEYTQEHVHAPVGSAT
ncbi:MAG TPA: hypothetical protein VEW93_10490 [Acidimicrobiales bacterium]|nr:hypothetical protein [Acidimicrobiales bacterium]